MYEWIIKYETNEVLYEIKKTGIVAYEPAFPEMKFIIMQSYLSKETIMNIKGVTYCEAPTLGNWN